MVRKVVILGGGSAGWRAARETALPESLAERFSLWSQRLPDDRNVNPLYHGFDAYSYSVMLLGLHHRPHRSLPVLDHLDSRNAWKTFRALRERAERLSRSLPSQFEYLTHVRRQAGVAQAAELELD